MAWGRNRPTRCSCRNRRVRVMSEQQDVYGDRNQAFASQNSHGAMASPVGETKAFASGGKVPVQLPPPPPGVPASQVERWRSEMKKIVEQQKIQEEKVSKRRAKDDERLRKEEVTSVHPESVTTGLVTLFSRQAAKLNTVMGCSPDNFPVTGKI
eukprot:309635-Rhodomonas_salina.1